MKKSHVFTILLIAVEIPIGSSFTAIIAGEQWGKLSTSLLFLSDGNPPPFEDWNRASPASPPSPDSVAPSLATDPYDIAYPLSSESSDGVDPIAAIIASQDAMIRKIQVAIPDLKRKPSTEAIHNSIQLQTFDAPGASNVAWLASICIPGILSSFTIFNGPLTDVPHLVSRCCLVDNNILQIAVDMRPRAYGAYELKDPITTEYPGPDQIGRKAFEYAAARNDYFTKFVTPEWLTKIESITAKFTDAVQFPLNESERLASGPMHIHLSMPATPGNVLAVQQLRIAMAEAWLQWSSDPSHVHRPGAPVNSQYVYDTKFRQNCYTALLQYYTSLSVVPSSAALAAIESGPLDEAYVGGAS